MNQPFTIDYLPGRTITHDGRTYLFFSGTAYLGIPQNPQMHALLTEGVARYGLHFGSSRNGNLQLAVFAEAEEKLARRVGAPAALTLSSGMLAGQVVMHWLADRVDAQSVGYQAPGTHPALWHPLLKPQIRALTDVPGLPAPAYVVTDSVNTIRSERYDFDWLTYLPNDQPVYVVVDDSHGIGILNGGRGIWPELAARLAHHPNVRLLVTASLAKAMGLPAGVVFGEAETLATIRQTAFFGACSPMPPAYAHAYLHAAALYADAQAKLTRNVSLARELLLPTGIFQQAEGYPVFYTDHNEIAPPLLEAGMFVYSFAYPTTAHKTNTRIVISAFHEEDDIKNLAEAVRRVV